MKQIAFLLVAVMTAVSGSAVAAVTKAETIHIVFLGSFENEFVQLFSSEKEVFGLYLNTEPTSGTAGSADICASSPTTKVTIRIPRLKAEQVMNLHLDKGSYLYVSFYNSHISFEQRKTPEALD